MGLPGKGNHRWVRTTGSDHALAGSATLPGRQFGLQHPNQVWASDSTALPTKEGELDLPLSLDLHSRTGMGSAVEAHLHASLPLAALPMAVSRREPPGPPPTAVAERETAGIMLWWSAF